MVYAWRCVGEALSEGSQGSFEVCKLAIGEMWSVRCPEGGLGIYFRKGPG